MKPCGLVDTSQRLGTIKVRGMPNNSDNCKNLPFHVPETSNLGWYYSAVRYDVWRLALDLLLEAG